MASTGSFPSWAVEGRDWPNRQHSGFVTAGGISWHVQEMGAGPPLLLLHGTGAATHSFRDLLPRLAGHFRVLAPDLPGHGFTQMPTRRGLSLDGMARLVGALVDSQDFEPEIVVGHSAGAAVLVDMAIERLLAPKLIVAINGALTPIRGAALFSPLAKLLFLNPLASRLFAARAANGDATKRLLEGTGSTIDARGVDLYARLFRKSGHVSATLGMMANWDLDSLHRRMAELSVPLVLMSASDDKAVSPLDSQAIAARLPLASVLTVSPGGHLVHEEHPDRIAAMIVNLAAQAELDAKDTVVN